jgi:hypothetical protein
MKMTKAGKYKEDQVLSSRCLKGSVEQRCCMLWIEMTRPVPLSWCVVDFMFALARSLYVLWQS